MSSVTSHTGASKSKSRPKAATSLRARLTSISKLARTSRSRADGSTLTGMDTLLANSLNTADHVSNGHDRVVEQGYHFAILRLVKPALPFLQKGSQRPIMRRVHPGLELDTGVAGNWRCQSAEREGAAGAKRFESSRPAISMVDAATLAIAALCIHFGADDMAEERLRQRAEFQRHRGVQLFHNV